MSSCRYWFEQGPNRTVQNTDAGIPAERSWSHLHRHGSRNKLLATESSKPRLCDPEGHNADLRALPEILWIKAFRQEAYLVVELLEERIANELSQPEVYLDD